MLNIEELVFDYGKGKLLDKTTYRFNENTAYCIKGKNGCGKTTLLRILGGIISPKSGEIQKPSNLRVGYIPSVNEGFYPRLTVLENLEYFGEILGHKRKNIFSIVKEIDLFSIDYWQTPLEECSKGMRQKISILRAISFKQNFYVFDEPLNGLDDDSIRSFNNFLSKKYFKIAISAQHTNNIYSDKNIYLDLGKICDLENS
ncbi:MAG: ATP-binding cassette domain-containing protein [Oligoflexia bacterium]|nr:ATP-binding cassette domain-containing protein [Oligoflexia bacterium]